MMPTSKTQTVNHNQTSSMANFVARLMSLSAHELQSLHNDHELMRQMTETQLLMENRLQQAKLNGFIQQQQLAIHHQLQIQQQQHQINQLNNQQHSPNGTTYQLAATQQSNQQQQLQMDQYYAQALSNAVSQQYSANSNNSAIINPTSQHLLMASPQANQLQLALDLRTSQQAGYLLPSHHQNHNQHHHQFQTNLGSPAQLQQQQQQQQINQRLFSSAGSYYGSSASSVSSAGSSPVEQVSQKLEKQAEHQQQAQRRSVNPKKIKLQEYQKQNISADMKLVNSAVLTPLPASNRAEPPPKRTCTINKQQTSAASSGIIGGIGGGGGGGGGKKYKGEFDEPSPSEVEQRQGDLARPDTNYHASDATECACVLGSRFHNKSNTEMLAVIERWRRLPTEERIKSKWDVTDLPKDIPLNEIKKFEDLRKDFSNGRADFGGASKRKPLGIRGTRQFLLILYCLWGHPGREDPMQKEGYCPHCFARIKKANEQSTLVRVVNHFNMKHRRGANPRLSPHRDNLASAAASPQAATINITPINIANERQSTKAAALTPPLIIKQEEDSMLPKELLEHDANGHHNDDESDNKSSILSKSLSTSAASSPEPTAASDALSSPPPSTNDDSSDTTKTVKPEQETSETTPSPPLTCSKSADQVDDTKVVVKTEEKN